MKIEIKNKSGEGSVTVGEYNTIRHELARALAAYLLENNLVEIEIKRGVMIMSVDVKKIDKNG
jgi:hypothetical protein